MVVVGGGMRANTESSRNSARAGAATTMSICDELAVDYMYLLENGKNHGDRPC